MFLSEYSEAFHLNDVTNTRHHRGNTSHKPMTSLGKNITTVLATAHSITLHLSQYYNMTKVDTSGNFHLSQMPYLCT